MLLKTVFRKCITLLGYLAKGKSFDADLADWVILFLIWLSTATLLVQAWWIYVQWAK